MSIHPLVYAGILSACVTTELSKPVHGASLKVDTGRLLVSGMLDEEDPVKFATLLLANPQVTEVEFNNCIGGTARAGYRISVLIKEHHLDTFVRNQCQSSCALAFMGGRTRRMSSGEGLHLLLFHGARNLRPDLDVAKAVTDDVVNYLYVLSGNRLSKQVMALISRSSRPDQGVVIYSQERQGMLERNVSYCEGMVNGSLSCSPLKDTDPVALGILTSQ